MKYDYASKRYASWRNKIYIRDDFTCQLCGTKGATLNAHHIDRKYDKPELAYKISNGITLCVHCHEIVTGSEQIFKQLFKFIVTQTLTLDYVYHFFSSLFQIDLRIVDKFKKYNTWLKIPETLINLIVYKKIKCERKKKTK